MSAGFIETKEGAKEQYQKVAIFPLGEEGRKERNNKDLWAGRWM